MSNNSIDEELINPTPVNSQTSISEHCADLRKEINFARRTAYKFSPLARPDLYETLEHLEQKLIEAYDSRYQK